MTHRNAMHRYILLPVIICCAAAPLLAKSPSLDDLLNIPSEAPKEQKPAEQSKEEALKEEARQILKQLSIREQNDQFKQVIEQMRDVSERLGGRRDAGLQTQREQQAIIDKLDQIIASAQKQKSQNQSNSSSQNQQQQQDRNSQNNQTQRSQQQQQQQQGKQQQDGDAQAQRDTQGPGGVADPKDADTTTTLEQHRADWGSLPQRLRDELLQGVEEKFSPIYEEMTRAYYRRLAEEAP